MANFTFSLFKLYSLDISFPLGPVPVLLTYIGDNLYNFSFVKTEIHFSYFEINAIRSCAFIIM